MWKVSGESAIATKLLPLAVSAVDPRASTSSDSRLRKRAAIWLSLLLVGCVVAWLAYDWTHPLPDLLAIRRVRPGMTEDEVVAVFGTRPTTNTPRQFNFRRAPSAPISGPTTDRYWHCDAGIVRVVLGADGRVQFAQYVGYGPDPTRIKLRRFLDRIGLGWLVS